MKGNIFMTNSIIKYATSITFDQCAQTIKTGVDLCFDENDEFIPFMPEFAKWYSILLYCSDAKIEKCTQNEAWEIICLEKSKSFHMTYLDDILNLIDQGIMYRKQKNIHKSSLIEDIVQIVDVMGWSTALEQTANAEIVKHE